MRAVAGLDAVTSGTVSFGDVDVSTIDERELRRLVAYVASERDSRGLRHRRRGAGRASSRSAHDDLASLGLATEPTTVGRALAVSAPDRDCARDGHESADLPTGRADERTRDRRDARCALAPGSTGSTVVVATHDVQS